MKTMLFSTSVFYALASAFAFLGFNRPACGQQFDWKKETPESQGFSREKLDALKDELAKRKTRAFLVIRNDKIVYEWYAEGNDAAKLQGTASLAKALVGGMSLGVAISDGRIKLDDPAAKYIPEWKNDPKKSKITVRQLGSHTSGLSDSTTPGVKHEDQPNWMGEFWQRLPPPKDPFTLARDNCPAQSDPGTKFQYSNPGIGLLTYCVTASLKDAAEKDARTVLKDRVLRPIGVPDQEWSTGYGKTFTVNDLPLVGSWGGGAFTPRAAARIGRLVLREGDWDGKRLMSANAMRQVTGDAGLPGHCGMGWWTNAGERYKYLPKDAVWGAGAGDQVLLVVPSLNLIVVRNGETLITPEELKQLQPKDVFEEFHDPRAKILFEPLITAINKSEAPYPPSKVITYLEWAPKDQIVRKAKGSDNWPLTWADDDHLYTAYGDGYGFEPLLKDKLSMGFARVEGGPADFQGINIRSPKGEQIGQGKDGKKSSGILMVDGVLYLWVRNAGNAQLGWSSDHGKTWEWADWKFTTSFGCPTFLNFGKNYAGARDDFAYVYSHDSDSAYTAADRMVLARVPKDQIRKRDEYEFFKGTSEKGHYLWTKDVKERGAVFTHKGKCYRSGITFNAALKRYLWCQTLPGDDPRFKGGFGIYDAPHPWGPWTTVFLTDAWDVGPGESCSFPTKWMSTEGKTLHLVFSGDDYFAVRKATLTFFPGIVGK
jgi:CubicO group peptidase (beta-lactamase class C family)